MAQPEFKKVLDDVEILGIKLVKYTDLADETIFSHVCETERRRVRREWRRRGLVTITMWSKFTPLLAT